MNTTQFNNFLASVEEVAANLEDLTDEMLPLLLDLSKQLAYMVNLEIKERDEILNAPDLNDGEPDECLEVFNQDK